MATTGSHEKISLFDRNTLNLAVIIVVVLSLMVDTYFAKNFIFSSSASIEGNYAFSIISVICTAGQCFILAFAKYQGKEILRKKRRLAILHKLVMITQIFLTAMLVLLLLQVHLISRYSSIIAILATLVTYSFSFGILVF